MSILVKKRVITKKATKIAGATIYLLATFVVPLTHTCHLHQSSLSTSDFNRPHRSGCSEVHGVRDAEPEPKQESHSGGFFGHECTACIHFNTCTAIEVSHHVTLGIRDVPTCTASSHSSRPLKRPEWTSSIVLRAPPFATS